MNDDELTGLALFYGADKAADHWYTPGYHRRFQDLQDEPVSLLEIGVGGYADPAQGGASLRMWRDYFPKGKIVGLDLNDKSGLTDLGDRVFLEQGDQTDNRVLHHLGKTYGPFDIIVDDGSHRSDDIMRSWIVLWEYLKDGGWYVIEDVGTAYLPEYGGSSTRTGDTTIGFLQGLIDRIHHREFQIPGYTPNRFDLTVVGLEIARNIAFIRKGDNGGTDTDFANRWINPQDHR